MVLVDPCIRYLDRICVSRGGEPSEALPREWVRDAVSKLQRIVSVKIAIKERQRSNNAARFKR